jgi:hypothetical protein
MYDPLGVSASGETVREEAVEPKPIDDAPKPKTP